MSQNLPPPQAASLNPEDYPVRLAGVTVAYRSYEKKLSSLKESFLKLVGGGTAAEFTNFHALQDVSFEVPRGKIFGIIGSNGSGKSTLLKVLAQVLKPTKGTVAIDGTVASLIELGVGFDPELNAIENIYLNGSLHKKTKSQLRDRVSQILDFAELHDFALTPIKHYSSGMAARLGFAVAIDINPDILLVDEILAVGDERFQTKCLEKFFNFVNSGKTIIIVTHNMEMLQDVAHTVMLLTKGQIQFIGDPKTAIGLYRDSHYQTALHA